jgi:iron complex outermembrane receptor protein
MARRQLLSSVAVLAIFAAGSPVLAQTAPAEGADASTADADIVIYGRGETRQVQTVTAADIQAEAPGTSPIKVLEKLPSVSIQSANALGTNEWSTRISIRGFSQSQLGFTLDGVPLGDMSYANFNGLHISRAIASENIGSSTVAQGSGALDTATSSNLGGTVQFFSMTPSDEMGVEADASYGSENAYRLFGRIETGDLGNGIKAYVSGSYLDAPKWKGDGKQEAWSVNSKLIVPLGTNAKITGFVNYSDFKDDDYMDLSPALQNKYGWDWDYLRNDYTTAVAIAANLQKDLKTYKFYCANYPGYSESICADDTYYNGYGLRKDILMAATLDADLSDTFNVTLTPYHHNNRGIGTWWTPYTATPGGAPFSIRATSYDIDRWGTTGALTLRLGTHELKAGGWYEANDYITQRRFFPLAAGTTSSVDNREWPEDPFAIEYRYNFDIDTVQYFLQDTWQVTPSLKINAGFKGLRVDVVNRYDASAPQTATALAARDTSGRLVSKDMFLPQAGVNYMISDDFELFAAYSENMRAFTTEPFMTNQAGFQAVRNTIKPETSQTIEGGIRFHLPSFEGSVAAYHVKFDNRLLSIQPCPIVVGCSSALSNVGSVTTNGAEVAGTYRLTRALSLYGAYSYTDATYDDDVVLPPATVLGPSIIQPTAGKEVVGTPKHIANGEIAYDDGTFIGRASVNYQSKRYYTYVNDNSVAGRTLVDLTAGFRFHGGLLKSFELQGNVTNLFDKRYFATIGQNGLTFSDPGGTLQSMLVGAPRQVFVSLRTHF